MMLHTYKAILRGNHIEWRDTPPVALLPDQPVAVHITILDETMDGTITLQPGQQMAVILEQLAAINALSDITDPASWERNIRTERLLPLCDQTGACRAPALHCDTRLGRISGQLR
jgi:hypothetical protein